jgi:hypothetical protein
MMSSSFGFRSAPVPSDRMLLGHEGAAVIGFGMRLRRNLVALAGV